VLQRVVPSFSSSLEREDGEMVLQQERAQQRESREKSGKKKKGRSYCCAALFSANRGSWNVRWHLLVLIVSTSSFSCGRKRGERERKRTECSCRKESWTFGRDGLGRRRRRICGRKKREGSEELVRVGEEVEGRVGLGVVTV
jgi:hypothetical protein